jgi:hypothetical protein
VKLNAFFAKFREGQEVTRRRLRPDSDNGRVKLTQDGVTVGSNVNAGFVGGVQRDEAGRNRIETGSNVTGVAGVRVLGKLLRHGSSSLQVGGRLDGFLQLVKRRDSGRAFEVAEIIGVSLPLSGEVRVRMRPRLESRERVGVLRKTGLDFSSVGFGLCAPLLLGAFPRESILPPTLGRLDNGDKLRVVQVADAIGADIKLLPVRAFNPKTEPDSRPAKVTRPGGLSRSVAVINELLFKTEEAEGSFAKLRAFEPMPELRAVFMRLQCQGSSLLLSSGRFFKLSADGLNVDVRRGRGRDVIATGARVQAAARLAGMRDASRELPLRIRNLELDKILPKVAAVLDGKESLRRVNATDNRTALARALDCPLHHLVIPDFEEVGFHKPAPAATGGRRNSLTKLSKESKGEFGRRDYSGGLAPLRSR